MMTMNMTNNQKELAKELQKSGFSRHDSRIYARNASDFMFQTGVSYVSGILTAATVGAARMVGHSVGWVAGKAVNGISNAIENRRVAARYQEAGADSQTAERAERAARHASRAARNAERVRREVNEDYGEDDEIDIQGYETIGAYEEANSSSPSSTDDTTGDNTK